MIRFGFVVLSLLLAKICYAHGISAADQESMIAGGNMEYIKLGALHMLTGYDHLLFLFGVIFFLDKFRDIVKFITAFTLGHVITLVFATFLGISANYFLIDAAIALTVVYKGFDNLGGFQKFFNTKSPNLLVLVFLFGLVHGFGLSTRLQQLPLGENGLLLKILSFNLGVEVGQIIALAVMLFLLNFWRKTESFKRFSTASNMALVMAGLALFVFQMVGFAGSQNIADYSDYSGPTTGSIEAETMVWTDTIELTIPAQGWKEFKFLVVEKAPLEYSWQTDGGPLYYDFHGEPSDGKPGEFQSFEKTTRNRKSGFLRPPFTGTFGWYWRNDSDVAVVVTLKTAGDYGVVGEP
ncbi:MAG: HupE/UreJ family protein [bacterium]|nr:HupE/UreJ family protein [bacterium]